MNPKTSIQQIIERDGHQMRQRAMIHRILHGLRDTVQLRGLTPETPVDDVRVDFTDESARFIAPLAEAVEILEAIIFASDGCMGNRECVHSMEPWQRARALLEGKWEADSDPRLQWPSAARREDDPR